MNISWNNVSAFDEKNITYDEDGNILTLDRNAYISGNITPMDNLQYSYEGNQLTNLNDGGSSTLGFKNLTSPSGNYIYDDRGNLTADPKKGLEFPMMYLIKPSGLRSLVLRGGILITLITEIMTQL